jgi:tripartite-type tricarboxylate transporter receptor subunit TctC
MRRAALAAALLLWAGAVSAQDYPTRPIRIIVPTPAGGPVDVMARVLANALPPVLGQNVFIENKPGAGNTIGSRAAASADPDGYTLMVSAASGLIMSPMIHKNAGYDASSFASIALVAETPQVLVVNAQTPFKAIADLVAYAKAHPGKLNYSTGGVGTLPHLNAELFKSVSGTNILHVPYKGGGPALTAVVAGEVQMTFDTVSTSLQLIQDGKLRALAIVGPKRAPRTAGRAGHAGDWISIGDERRLDRTDGAARYAACHHREAQYGDQCRASGRCDEDRAVEARCTATRRQA